MFLRQKGSPDRYKPFLELCEVGAEREVEYTGLHLEHHLLATLGYGLSFVSSTMVYVSLNVSLRLGKSIEKCKLTQWE